MKDPRGILRGCDKLTILYFADSRLDIVQGQIADLVFKIGEIHDARHGLGDNWESSKCDKKEGQQK